MTKQEYLQLLNEIESLPQGGITYKKINGKKYAYYQWRENGKQHAKRIKNEEIKELSKKIEKRKLLQTMKDAYSLDQTNEDSYDFQCVVRIGNELENFARPVAFWKKRECYQLLHDYVYGTMQDRVFILYGLRRTGKTTLIRQLIHEMPTSMKEKTVFFQIQEGKTLAHINHDLKILESQGYQYVFIDEVTLLNDFISGAALFSDIFASSGMKIILSGTDSLGFLFAENEELFDRCIMCHTTFIPYREFEHVLGITGIDRYICYGGTMSLAGVQYNELSTPFSTKRQTNEYIDSAIAKNIQHSLKNYDNEGHFRSLKELYDNNELTNAINRIVEDINHRFTIEVLTRDFNSNDIKISANNLRKDRTSPTDVLDNIDIRKVNNSLKSLLEIKDKKEQSIVISDAHRVEIKEYFDLLDLTVELETRWMSDFNHIDQRTAFSQPGIRYSQAEALIKSLLLDDLFRNLSLDERNRITKRILDEIRGRMMEDIVLLETKLAKKDCEVFRLQFAIGEFDMVIFYPKNNACEIFEIKHSKKIVRNQCRHLLDKQKCSDTEFRYGKIRKKCVIYRGETSSLWENGIDSPENISYLNVEEYLCSL